MESRTATVGSAVGLHARPAAVFVKAVADSGHRVTIAKPGSEPVDAASILSVMGLGAACGDTVELAVEGPDAASVLAHLAALVESDLDA